MATSAPCWTIDELGAQVALALSVDYDGPPNSRVREVPDRRTIRYYTTLGLLDRPAEMRGRTALYSRRHLLQLVAIKRLQARGLALAQIQEQLTGLPDAALQRLARLPETDSLASATPAVETEPDRRSQAFWTTAPAPLSESSEAAEEAAGRSPSPSGALQGVPLGDEILLVLAAARPVEEDDLSAIRVAAAPLLKLLETRRLIGPRPERGPS
jgi:DNA-binding transcriptional MerR regulator